MTPQTPQPEFAEEEEARRFLEELLLPWFFLKPEVELSYPGTANRLRIDYLAKPKPDTGFPFPLFGIECKAACRHGGFNRAVKQAIDYTKCRIVDERSSLARVRGQPVARVYVFPAPPAAGIARPPVAGEAAVDNDYARGWHDGVERVAGLFRVGLIYLRHTGAPCFAMSGDRQWDPDNGPIARPTHLRNPIGSGVNAVAPPGGSP